MTQVEQQPLEQVTVTTSTTISVVEGKLEPEQQQQEQKQRRNKLIKQLSISFLIYGALLVVFAFLFIVHATPLVFHEIFGLVVAVVVIAHVYLLRSFFSFVLKQSQAIFIYRDIVLLGLAISLLVSLVSGVIFSKVLFKDVWNLPGGTGEWREVHTIATSYLLVFIGLHLGCYARKFYLWLSESLAQIVISPVPASAEMPMVEAVKRSLKVDLATKWIKRFLIAALVLISLNGAVQFISTSFGDKLLGQRAFSFYDFERPWIANVVDQLSIMFLFTAISLVLCILLQNLSTKREK